MKKAIIAIATAAGLAAAVVYAADQGRRAMVTLDQIADGTTVQTISGGVIDNSVIGGTTPAAGNFTTLDANSLTVDAGAGVDNQAAGTLVLGAATATKVEIADAGVETEIQGTLDQQQAATFSADIIGASAETVDNAVDSQLRITFDDDAATLGTLKLETDNAHTNMGDNDLFRIIAQADNDVNESLAYATHQFKILDVTTNTEDGAHVFLAQVNGTDTTLLTVDASGATVVGDVSGTTIGGITEANLVDKSAAETIAGTWDFAKVTLDVASQTVTNGQAITGGKSYTLLTGTAGGTTNTIANQVEGQLLVVINTSANPIVIADSGNVALAGNVTLGQNDSLTLFWTAAGNGVEISRSDN